MDMATWNATIHQFISRKTDISHYCNYWKRILEVFLVSQGCNALRMLLTFWMSQVLSLVYRHPLAGRHTWVHFSVRSATWGRWTDSLHLQVAASGHHKHDIYRPMQNILKDETNLLFWFCLKNVNYGSYKQYN